MPPDDSLMQCMTYIVDETFWLQNYNLHSIEALRPKLLYIKYTNSPKDWFDPGEFVYLLKLKLRKQF
jgi:hypothetical protein